MKEVDELLESVITVDDGLRIIANLEAKSSSAKKKGEKDLSQLVHFDLLEEFKRVFYKLPVVGLTLAINPNLNFLMELHNWFCENLGEAIIFDLKVDSTIIGGAKIICNEHYKDFSIDLKVEEVLGSQPNVEADSDSTLVPSTLI